MYCCLPQGDLANRGTLYFMEDNPKPGWEVRTWMLQDRDKPSDLISLSLSELLKDSVFRKKWESVKSLPLGTMNFIQKNFKIITLTFIMKTV